MKTGNVVAIVQARMGSSRFPGKVLKNIGDKSILEVLIERLQKSKKLDNIIIATTTNMRDNVVVDFAEKLGISCYRGSENNVLSRYVEAAERYKAEIIVRVTADNPLTDPVLIDMLVEEHMIRKAEYTCCYNAPLGVSSEIIDFTALKTANNNAYESSEKEHVTTYIKSHPEKFKIHCINFDYSNEKIRLTVDTIEDLILINALYEELGDLNKINTREIIDLLNKKQELMDINNEYQNHPNKIKKKDVKITVIIRTHNSEKFIKNALESVFKQSLGSKYYEIMVIDDGSIDKTLSILDEFNNKILLFKLNNVGYIKPINIGIKNSNKKYIILLDADDTFESTILEDMYIKLESNNTYSFAYSDYFEHFLKDNKKKIMSVKDNIFNCLAAGIMFKSEIFNNIGFYDETLIFPEYDILIKLLKKYRGCYIEKPLYNYFRHDKNITANKDIILKGLNQLYEKYGEKIPIRNY